MYFKNISEISQLCLETLSINNGHLLIFVAEKSAEQAELLIDLFTKNNIKIIGGIYPTIIRDTANYDEGILVIKIPPVKKVIKFLLDDETTFDNIENFETIKSAIVLTDGMMPKSDYFLKKIYGIFGNQMNIFGGGAGFITLQQQPCVFTNEGIFENGTVMALLECPTRIGVKHGWEVFAGPFIATSTDKNIIKELNWRPAFEVYKEVIEGNSDKKVTTDNFFEIAKNFPFGIYKEGTEFVVRDPFSANENNEIVCFANIPENSTLQILTGDPDSLIKAAKEVGENVRSKKPNDDVCLMVFECITRVMYLGERFDEELNAMKGVFNNNTCKIRGVSTLGEIASSGMGYVELYNRTIVASNFIH